VGVRGSYDTEAIRGGSRQLHAAADGLTGLNRQLGSVAPGAFPHVVEAALEDLSRHGKDMISDITAETKDLGDGLDKAAACYEDLDNSMVRYFRGDK
jgi:hypothetical protein